MDERDPILEQGPVSIQPPTPDDQQIAGEAVPIPPHIRDAMTDMRQRLRAEPAADDAVVREYESRYTIDSRVREEHRVPPGAEVITGAAVPYKTKRMPDPLQVDENERKWAALAHASTLVTALLALPSGGLLVLLTMFAPLLIYFAFRRRSEYVAFHALQAFSIQLIGTIGFLVVVIFGIFAWTALIVLSALLVLLVIGIVLLPVVVLAALAYFLVSLVLPLGMVIYSVIAVFETWKGRNYRIPYVARWVESQMYSD